MSKQPNHLDIGTLIPHAEWTASDEYRRAARYVARQPDADTLAAALGLDGARVRSSDDERRRRDRERLRSERRRKAPSTPETPQAVSAPVEGAREASRRR